MCTMGTGASSACFSDLGKLALLCLTFDKWCHKASMHISIYAWLGNPIISVSRIQHRPRVTKESYEFSPPHAF